MIRPTAAFFIAALAAIGTALGAGYTLYPAQGDAAKLSVTEAPRKADAPASGNGENLHVVREHPMKEGKLVSPFLPEHPTREQARAEKAASVGRQKVREAQPTPPPAREQEIRLVGVVSSGDERRAILSVGKRQILMAPGEEKDGVTLVSVTERAATVSTAAGERELSLSSGIIK